MNTIEDTFDNLKRIAKQKIQSERPRWTSDEEGDLNYHLRMIFDSLTYQQYLYDVDGLKDFLQCLSALNLSGLSLEPESHCVCRKLLAHQAYSERPLWNLSTRILLNLDDDLRSLDIDEEKKTWYRLFSIDHAVSRLYSLDDKEQIRGRLVGRFHELLERAQPGRYILREAHFHGHLGNDALKSLQDLKGPGNKRGGLTLVATAKAYYLKAVELRLEMLESNFAQEPGVSAAVERVRKYFGLMSSEKEQTARIEQFHNPAQAISDTAQQLTGLLSVACYELAFVSKRNRVVLAERIQSLSSLTREFWDLLRHQLVTTGGIGHYRIIERRRISEHMLAILRNRNLILQNTDTAVSTDRYTTRLKDWEFELLKNFESLIR